MNLTQRVRSSIAKNAPDIKAALTGGFPRFVLGQPSTQEDGIPVFCYHRALPERVEQDLNYLRENGYRPLSLTEFEQQLASSHTDPQAVVLTVDDGASSLYRVLYPAIRKFNMPLIAFVAAGMHEDRYNLPEHQRPCTWEELKEMSDSGLVHIQSHTWSHRFIPRWPEPLPLVDIAPAHSAACQLRLLSLSDDLALARETLEKKIGVVVDHLAFPMYQGTEAALREGQKIGYRGFWWGTLPHRRANQAGDPLTRIVRISADYIQRLPGRHRMSRWDVLRRRRQIVAL